jgi:hypothetical protein
MHFKIISILLLSALFTIEAQAQLPLNLGIKGGLSYSILDTDFNNARLESNGGIIAGPFARLKVKKYSLQAEALFLTRKGAIAYNNVNNVERLKRFHKNSIDLNLLFGYVFLDAKIIKLRGLIGASNSQNIYQGGNLVKDSYNSNVYSGLVGISLDIPFFLFEVRYQHGFSPFYEGAFHDLSTIQANPTGKVNNNMLHFTVGYKFF